MPANETRTHRHQSLLVIDQLPLFTEALDDCQRAFRAAELLKAELHEYETRDRPAYERWYNSSLGARITEVREGVEAVREREVRLSTVRKRHWAKFFGSESPIHVECAGFGGGFAEDEGEGEGDGNSRARARRSAWDAGDGPGESDDESDSFLGAGFRQGRFDDEENDDEAEWGSDGDDPLNDSEYSEYFKGDWDRRSDEFYVRGFDERRGPRARRPDEQFDRDFDEEEAAEERRRRKSTGPGFYRPPGAGGSAARDDDDGLHEGAGAHAAGGEAGAAAARVRRAGRLKEKYRLLVRKLHPDLNPELTPEGKGLWNQVQKAYAERNVEQLDLLLALSDVFAGKVSEATSLFQLRRAGREVERLLAPLRRRLESARQDRAWKFAELADRAPLKRQLDKELAREAAKLRELVRDLDAQIERFTRNERRRAAPVSGRTEREAERR